MVCMGCNGATPHNNIYLHDTIQQLPNIGNFVDDGNCNGNCNNDGNQWQKKQDQIAAV